MCIWKGHIWGKSGRSFLLFIIPDLMLLEEMFIYMYEYRNRSFSPEDGSLLLSEVTFDSRGVQVEANSLKVSCLMWRWDSCGVGHTLLQPSLSSLPPSPPPVVSQLCSTTSLSLVKDKNKDNSDCASVFLTPNVSLFFLIQTYSGVCVWRLCVCWAERRSGLPEGRIPADRNTALFT